MEKYINYDMCKECGGECCKQNGCVYLPQDFKSLDFEYLKAEIDKGNISIGGEPITGFLDNAWTFLLYLRARNVDSDIVELIPSGNPCKLLTPTGCSLEESARPSLGLSVNPIKVGGPCQQMCDSLEPLNWLQHCEVLSELVKYYTNREVVDVLVEQIGSRMKNINEKLGALEELKAIEVTIASWYKNIINRKPYFAPEEVKCMTLLY